ncbi:MAG: phenylalanine--tRNA ligase subunit alpha [Candidatus Nanosalina sp.]
MNTVKLSAQALEILRELKKKNSVSVEELSDEGYDQAMVNRAAIELEDEELAEIEEEEEEIYRITETGKEVIEQGSPEYRLAEKVKDEPKRMSDLQELNLDVALGKARQKHWIAIENGEVRLEKDFSNIEDRVSRKLKEEEFSEDLVERGLVETDEKSRRTLVITDKGENLDFSSVEQDFDVEARAKTPRTGKKHFYKNVMSHARRIWTRMGFQEMEGDFVVPSILNFDALYTPQDHPARELQDTFFLENPEFSDLEFLGEKVQRIKEVHESGGDTGSKGWGYDWSEQEASRNVLRTHTTAASALTLHQIDIEDEELPKKYFKVARNFRNETVDRHHLPEFIQTEGIVVGEGLNFKNLKAYISEFFDRMGYEEFRLIPSYYPYTEMSVEVQVWEENTEEWVGLGGAGIFRPEVVKPLLGREVPVLAWGLGFGRIAFLQMGLEDIRELYRNDIENLEEMPVWRPES